MSLAAVFGIPDPEPWELDALCAQVDSDLFYPEKGGTTAGAKLICGLCDVRVECLAKALESEPWGGPRWGVWGGLAPHQRRALRGAV